MAAHPRSQRRGPDRNRAYLAWVRTLACVVCHARSSGSVWIEAAHTKVLGPKAMGRKTSDFSAIPLCYQHHQVNPDSYHRLGERAFASRHAINLGELVRRLNHLYQQDGCSAADVQVEMAAGDSEAEGS